MKKISFLFSIIFLLVTGNLSAQSWAQVGADIDGEAAGDTSGYSVSISADGKRVAILAPENAGGSVEWGHVRVYEENGGVWTQLGGDFNGSATFNYLAYSVSLSGDGKRLAIHAKGNGTASWNGYVRVYSESGGVWTQVGGTINGEGAYDSARRVSLSYDGKRIAIGAPYNDGTGTDYGHVRVYKQTGSNWVQVGADIDATGWGYFGWSVSLSGDGKRVAIGALGTGKVKVYSESGGSWTQLGGDLVGVAPDQTFGRSVSLSSDGTHVAVGATYGTNGSGLHSGHVRVFSESGGVWTQVGSNIDGEAEENRFGYSVSLSSNGHSVAFGALYNDTSGVDAGHVRVYSISGGIWTQVGVDIEGEAAGDESGYAVSLSGDGERVAIGAIYNDGNGIDAGHVRVYEQVPCDADGDGYDNLACGGSDCDDNNASVNPGTTDICNGLDDNCDGTVDEGAADADGDGICDSADNCPAAANPDQADADGDGAGDACDACPNDPDNDSDGDGICGQVDNCPSTANSGQEDGDCDGVGDACDVCPTGDDSMDNNNDGIPDCSQLLNYSLYSSTWYCGTNKIKVCHSGVEQCISKNQLSTHFAHAGDDIGPCTSCSESLIMPGSNGSFAEMAEQEFEMFPNPAGKEVTFHLHGFGDESADITLFDYSGKAVWQTSIEEGQHELTLDLSGSAFVSGVYFVKVSSASNVQTGRLVISK